MHKIEDNGYEAIGKFVVEFSKLTYVIALCIGKLVKNNQNLLRIILKDAKVDKKITKAGYKITAKNLDELWSVLMSQLTTGEISKILKAILLEQYKENSKFKLVLDVLFHKIDTFCSYDGIRNHLLHSGIYIDKNLSNGIEIHRMMLEKGILIEKPISGDLDKINKELSELAVIIYGFSKILHFDNEIEKYIILENKELRFLYTAEKIIHTRTTI